MTDETNHITFVWVDDLDGTEACPVCGSGFDFDDALLCDSDWEETGGYYDHHSGVGQRTYACPTEDCAGKIEVRTG